MTKDNYYSLLYDFVDNPEVRQAVTKFAENRLRLLEERLLTASMDNGREYILQLKSEHDGAKKLYGDILNIKDIIKQETK